MLANDIIALLSNEGSSLSDALLKTKVFLHEIGKKELAEWVTYELNGYPDGIALPSYRILESRVMGDLLAPGWTASDQALPIQHLEPAYREQLEKSEMRESLRLVEELATKKQGSIRRPFPPKQTPIWAATWQAGGVFKWRGVRLVHYLFKTYLCKSGHDS